MDDDERAGLNRWGRRAWGALDVLQVLPTFSAETHAAAAALGLDPRFDYFAYRAAPLGVVPPSVVTATFSVFSPGLVARALRDVWTVTTPEAVVAARYATAAQTLRRAVGDALPPLDEVLPLLRTACAALTVPGRPLFAAWAALPWPEEPLQQLWHAATLVREHRGDGHMAALVHAPLDPVEALLLAGLVGPGLAFARATRGWREADWAAGLERLAARGLVTGADVASAAVTDAGRALHADVEARTDAAALAPWQAIGRAGTEHLAHLLHPARDAALAAGLLPATLLAR